MSVFIPNTHTLPLSPCIIDTGNVSLPLSPHATQAIEDTWRTLTANDPSLFSAPLFRYVTHDATNTITIHAHNHLTYKDVVGLRNTPQFVTHIEQTDHFRALSLIMLVRTSDGFGVLVERNSGDWPHSLELSGGFLRYARGTNIDAQKLQLFTGDFGTDERHIATSNFLGFLDYAEICEMMCIYSITLTLTFTELQSFAPKPLHAMPHDYTSERHSEFFTVPLHAPSQTVLSIPELKKF